VKLLTLVLSFALFGISYAGPQEVNIVRFTQEPDLDGRLNDACWVSSFKGEMQPRDRPPSIREQTTVHIGYDDTALYVAARCSESKMHKLKEKTETRDGNVWEDDCIEVFLNPGQDEKCYYHFIVNPRGVQYDAYHGHDRSPSTAIPVEWNAPWQAAADKDKESWSVELAIPFHALRIGDKEWRICICREERPSAEYSGLAGWFHKPEEFGIVEGLDIDFAARFPCKVESVSFGSLAWGINTFHAVLESRGRQKCAVDAILALLNGQGEILSRTAMPLNLSPATQVDAVCQYTVSASSQEPRQRAVFTVRESSSGRTIYETSRTFRIPRVMETELDKRIYYTSATDAVAQVRLRVGVNTYASLRLLVTVNDVTPNKEVIRRNIDSVVADNDVRLNIGALGAGSYNAEFLLFDRAGNRIARTENRFERIQGPFDCTVLKSDTIPSPPHTTLPP